MASACRPQLNPSYHDNVKPLLKLSQLLNVLRAFRRTPKIRAYAHDVDMKPLKSRALTGQKFQVDQLVEDIDLCPRQVQVLADLRSPC